MGTPILLLASILSFLPALADGAPARSLDGVSRLALAVLPWLALQGLPQRRTSNPRPLAWLADLGLALPLLALGAWLDLRGGADSKELAITAAGALALLAVLGEATVRGGDRSSYAVAWMAILAGGPALAFALSERSAPAAFLARASPIHWVWERLRLDNTGSWEEILWGPLPGALALLLVAFGGRRRAEGKPA